MLVIPFGLWVASCVAVGMFLLRRAPAVSLALLGGVVGALVGFAVGNADGPAEVPAYSAVGASAGLVVAGLIGILLVPSRPPSRVLNRAAAITLAVAPFAAAGMTLLLQLACPPYVMGRGSGFCNYQGVDVLGGWVSGVIVAFVFDALFVAALLFASAGRARRAERRSRV